MALPVSDILNGEGGLSVRNKLNEVIAWANALDAAGAEANTLDNRGAGAQIALPAEPPLLPVRSLKAGANVTITQNANDIEIASTGGGGGGGDLSAADIDTLAELNAILTDATLDDSGDPRTPTAHNHAASDITGFDAEVANNSAVALNTAKRSYPSADETKVAGIEPAATADQTDAEIETAYNNRVAVASQAEVQAGTLTDVRRVTPERLLQASQPRFTAQFANKPPGEAILLVCTGQSNVNRANFRTNQTAPPTNNRVFDWSTDGTTAFDRANLAWRNVDPTDEYLYGLINVGTSRKAERSPSVYEFTEHMAFAAADELQQITGRDVCIVNAARGGTAIDDANGWGYDPGSDNVLDVLSEEVANAIASPPAGVTLPASPDIVLFAQGESDAIAGKESGRYGYLLEQLILDCEDSNRYGWADAEKTHWYILEMAPETQETYLYFNGHAVADEITADHVHLVRTHGATTVDGLHYPGEDAAMLGRRAAHMAITGIASAKSGMGGIRSRKLMIDPASVVTYHRYEGESNSAPPSGEYNDNAGHTKLRIHKTDANPFGAKDHSDAGFASLHRDGCTITMEQQGNAANFRAYTVDSLPADMGTYWEWDVTSYSEGGTPPTGSTTSHITADRKMFDGSTVQADTGLPFASSRLGADNTFETYSAPQSLPFDVAALMIDGQGIVRRRGGIRVIPKKVQKTLDVTNSALLSFLVPENAHIWAKCTVVGANPTSHSMFKGTAETIGYRLAAGWQQQDADYQYQLPATGFTLTWAAGAFNTTELRLTTTSNNTEVWDFDIELEVMVVEPAS